MTDEAITNARRRLRESARVFEALSANAAKERAHIARLRAEMNAEPLAEHDDPMADMARACSEAADELENGDS